MIAFSLNKDWPIVNSSQLAVEVLERKGLCTKQDHFDIITVLRQKNARAKVEEKGVRNHCLAW